MLLCIDVASGARNDFLSVLRKSMKTRFVWRFDLFFIADFCSKLAQRWS